MTVIYAIFLALLQGIAEFLPVSSSGHLAALQNLVGQTPDVNANLLFIAFLHFGTLIAVFVSFRRDLRSISAELAILIRGRDDAADTPPTPPARLAILIAAATAPLILAIPLYGAVRVLFTKTGFIGVMLVATGAILYVTTKYIKSGGKTERTFGVLDAVLVGAAQLLSLIPGLSRVGATVTVGFIRGAERDFAVKFSYLLSIPAVIGAIFATLVGAVRNGIDFSIIPLCLLGTAVSAVVGIFAIGFLRMMMSKDKFTTFSYYNVIAGTVLIILSLIF
ncbi:MAG: undecaprenyl-diphosphate phosphatase [Oscillospiraceae bacterium]|jgi:undecaprenyl-diphosphatase|nr:undecaprenyl-diphosphate phosphatase [Oscillospiraceae bacterium]